jgi:poly(beta-D-mannuronate) lyase
VKLPLAAAALLTVSALLTSPALADCEAVPPAVRDLALERFYEDSAGAIVEPTRMEEHKALTAPLAEFVGTVTRLADRAHQQRSAPDGTARCALGWIAAWARDGAYLGSFQSKQSQAQRKWDLAGIALAYLKLKHWATVDDRATIEPWLIKVADAARAHFDDAGIKRNNHWYWMGLALAAVGTATGSDTHWQMAKSIFADAAKDITADGTLPLEMAREGRALYYHVFTLEPLVVLAEMAAARGEDWYQLNDGALHRLVAKTVQGLAEPAIFDTLAGVKQQRPVKTGYGWAWLYRDRFFDRMKDAIPQPIGHRWLGGNADVLKKVLSEK